VFDLLAMASGGEVAAPRLVEALGAAVGVPEVTRLFLACQGGVARLFEFFDRWGWRVPCQQVHAAERFGDVQGLTVFEHELLDSFYAIGGAVGVDVASFAGFFDASRCLFEASYEEGRCEGRAQACDDDEGLEEMHLGWWWGSSAKELESWRVGVGEQERNRGIEDGEVFLYEFSCLSLLEMPHRQLLN
jgi:hypothetical protein